MLDESREELKHEITAVRLEVKALDSRVTALDSRVTALDSKVTALDSKVDALKLEMNARFESLESKMDAKIETVLAAVHRVGLLVEEQNARNKFVLMAIPASTTALKSWNVATRKRAFKRS